MDQLVTTTAAGGSIRVRAAVTTSLVAEARERHDCAPTATAALGRLMTAAALMGGALKGQQRVALQIAGAGPMRNLVAEAFPSDDAIGVRGMTPHPEIDLPLNGKGKFDVGGAVGRGVLQVTRSHESGQPYTGIVDLVSGEIGEDIASYFANSEQTPSIVALGVLAGPRGVIAAGGVIAELLPGAPAQTIDVLERSAAALPPVTGLVRDGADAWAIAQALVGELAPKRLRAVPVRFACRCSRQKVEAAMRGLGAASLAEIVREGDSQRVTCDYCKRLYVLTPQEIEALAQPA
ncbi:MAG: Hsp33 family molecular chaperone HslO [bacterium]|nr:Hsp33 family molecular chaperone HslO [bacterium]